MKKQKSTLNGEAERILCRTWSKEYLANVVVIERKMNEELEAKIRDLTAYKNRVDNELSAIRTKNSQLKSILVENLQHCADMLHVVTRQEPATNYAASFNGNLSKWIQEEKS